MNHSEWNNFRAKSLDPSSLIGNHHEMFPPAPMSPRKCTSLRETVVIYEEEVDPPSVPSPPCSPPSPKSHVRSRRKFQRAASLSGKNDTNVDISPPSTSALSSVGCRSGIDVSPLLSSAVSPGSLPPDFSDISPLHIISAAATGDIVKVKHTVDAVSASASASEI